MLIPCCISLSCCFSKLLRSDLNPVLGADTQAVQFAWRTSSFSEAGLFPLRIAWQLQDAQALVEKVEGRMLVLHLFLVTLVAEGFWFPLCSQNLTLLSPLFKPGAMSLKSVGDTEVLNRPSILQVTEVTKSSILGAVSGQRTAILQHRNS